MTTAKLTTGKINALFLAAADQVELVIHYLNTNEVVRETLTLAAGREHYAQFRKWGATVGATRPVLRVRKITTDAQFGAWAQGAFDMENDDNAPESLLAYEECFAGQGFLEVAA